MIEGVENVEGVNTTAAANKIVEVLAELEIPISLIDATFAIAKGVVYDRSYVRKTTLVQVAEE